MGKRIFGLFISSETGLNETIPVSYEEGKEPYCSVQSFNHMLQDEKNRPGKGQYTYLHSVLPHPPFVYDREGNYSLNYSRSNLYAYYEHVQFAFKMIEDFIQELKRLNRYHDATIIIHSDTGRGEYGFYKKSDQGLYGTLKKDQNFIGGKRITEFFNKEDNLPVQLTSSFKDHRLGRLRSIFMIKPLGDTEPFNYSEKQTQLIDVYPTLLDTLSLLPQKNEEIDGVSVYKASPQVQRDALWYWFPQKAPDPVVYELLVTDPSDIENSEIKFNRIVEDVDITPFPHSGIQVNIGSHSEEPLKFKGVGKRDGGGKFYYRWIVEKEAAILFKNIRFDKDTEVLLEISTLPFSINENLPMVISSALSNKVILLKKGLHSYKVMLRFPKNKDPEIRLTFQDAKSPESLGLGTDSRNLAALVDQIRLTRVTHDTPQKRRVITDDGLCYDFGSQNETGIEFLNFGSREGSEASNWRWGMGKKSHIILTDLSLNEDTEITLTLTAKPFQINENTEMRISTGISEKVIKLLPDINTYTVNLKLPSGTRPEINLHPKNAESPAALGINKDKRELSVLVDRICVFKSKE